MLMRSWITTRGSPARNLPTTSTPKPAAVLPRADTADALVFKKGFTSLATLPPGVMIATSSLRRQRQLLWQRPDLRVCKVRGNVGTRLRKLHA